MEFDELHMNGSYAIVGGMLRAASAKRQRADVVYHPSNLGFKFPRQFRELAAIGNQWRFFNDVRPSCTQSPGLVCTQKKGGERKENKSNGCRVETFIVLHSVQLKE